MAPPTASAAQTEDRFERDLGAAFRDLRGTLIEALQAVDCDPHRARELGRRLAVNKNLAWRATRIVAAEEAAEAVPHVPGAQAFGALITALGAQGLPPAAQERLRAAHRTWRDTVAEHSDDQATLEQLAVGLGGDRGALERLEAARRQAFLGMGATWGVQARSQFSTYVLGPPVDGDDRIDAVVLSGRLGLRRLRADARWTLFHRQHDTKGEGPIPAPVPIEDLDDPDGPPFLRAHCSPELPALEQVADGETVRWMLPPGPVGNTAALDVVFGTLHRRAVSVDPERGGDVIDLSQRLITPVQLVQFDLVVHTDHPWARAPECLLRSQLEGLRGPVEDDVAHPPLPLLERLTELGEGAAAMASPDVPGYGAMLARIAERTAWDLDAFVGHRLVMRYPPIPSLMEMRIALTGSGAG